MISCVLEQLFKNRVPCRYFLRLYLEMNLWSLGATSSAPAPEIPLVSMIKIYSQPGKLPLDLSMKRRFL